MLSNSLMAKKKREPEYTLNVFHHHDERTNKSSTVFLVQTTKIFVSFRYEILLDAELTGNKIDLYIVGLHAPVLLMPGTGPAQGRKEYEGLKGNYVVRVTKQDKSSNDFELEITPTSISIRKEPENPFVLISTDAVEI